MTRHVALAAAAAAGLAASGVALTLAGQRLGVPLLERWLGPAVTLAGAALWVGFRARRRGG